MSSLSTLLNPAPSSLEPPRDAPLDSNAYKRQHVQADSAPSVDGGSLNRLGNGYGHRRNNASLGSPLDTLAAAASSIEQVYSPTSGKTTAGFGIENPQAHLSRPASSQVSPPPTFQSPTRSTGHFSPGLEQYHQPTSQEVKARRHSELSNVDSTVLPPLISVRAEEDSSRNTMQVSPPLARPGMDGARKEDASLQPANVVQYEHARHADAENSSHVDVTRQLHYPDQHARPGPPLVSAETNHIKVKTEASEPLPPTESIPPPAEKEVATLPENTKPEETAREPLEDKAVTATIEVKPDLTEAEHPASRVMPTKKKAAPKKRPAPKKGTASVVKPPSKKRKLDVDSVASSPPSSLLRGTPASSRTSKTPAPRNRLPNSETPTRSSSVVDAKDGAYGEDDDSGEEGDDEVFCVCRKPDDHAWMIACDGSCDDWYHGKCVGMDERDGNLIDKYICPNCKTDDRQTVYKPKCRLDGCRAPARITIPSKYCSEEHGVEFMRHLALKRPPDVSIIEAPNKKRRKSTHTEHTIRKENDEIVEGPKTPPHLRGGMLAASELKTLSMTVESVADFKAMGNSILLTPPGSSGGPNHPTSSASPLETIAYADSETARLSAISKKLSSLSHTIGLLTQQEKLCMVVRARAKAALETLKQRGEQLKEICGYDSCLAWSMPEFESWYESEQGKETLGFDVVREWSKVPARVLSKPIKHVGGAKVQSVNGKHDVDGDKSMLDENGDNASHEDSPAISGSKPPPAAADVANNSAAPARDGNEGDDDDPVLKGICLKKRCTRHRDWFKYETQGIHSEKGLARQESEKLKEEERELRQRAAIRVMEEEEEGGGG